MHDLYTPTLCPGIIIALASIACSVETSNSDASIYDGPTALVAETRSSAAPSSAGAALSRQPRGRGDVIEFESESQQLWGQLQPTGAFELGSDLVTSLDSNEPNITIETRAWGREGNLEPVWFGSDNVQTGRPV